MNETIAYLPNYLTAEQIDLVQDKFIRLVQGERGGLALEKLNGLDLYSIRINDTHRLLLTKIDGKWVALEYVGNHDYHKAKCMKPGVLKRLLKTKSDPILLGTETFVETEETIPANAKLVPAYFHGHHTLILNTTQQNAVKLDATGVIIGPPGSGKTSVCIAILQEFVSKYPRDDTQKPSIAYLVPTRELIDQLSASWSQNPLFEESDVHFLTYADLVPENTPKEISPEQLKKWFKLTKAALKKQYSNEILQPQENQLQELRIEFSLIKALGSDDYLKAGNNQCCFPTQKALMQQLFKNYRAFLHNNNLSDPYLNDIKKEQEFDLVLTDEGQIFSPYQHQQIHQMTARHGRYTCVDREQCINTAGLIEDFVCRLYAKTDSEFKEPHILTETYRCPPNVVELANAIIAFGLAHGPAKSRHRYKSMVSNVEYPGECYYFDIVTPEINEYLRSLCRSPDTLVLAFAEQLKSDFVKGLEAILKFTPGQALGFDAETVILVNPFTHPLADSFVTHNDIDPPNLAEWAWFRSVFVALTRASRRLIMIQDKQHRTEVIQDKLKSLCQGSNLVDSSPDSDANEKDKWNQRYRQAMSAGFTHIARQIKEKYGLQISEETPLPAQLATSLPKPVQASAQPPKVRLITPEQIQKWCKGGVTELNKQFGLNHKHKLSPLFELLQSEKNAAVFLTAIKANNILRNLFKNMLGIMCKQKNEPGPSCLLHHLVLQAHCHNLLEDLVSQLSKEDKKRVKELLNEINLETSSSWFVILLQRSRLPCVINLFHELDDQSWFEQLIWKKHGVCLLDSIVLETAQLERLARLIHKSNNWSILTNSISKLHEANQLSITSQNLLGILELLFTVILPEWNVSLLQDLMRIFRKDNFVFLKGFEYKNTNVCLLNFCINHILMQGPKSIAIRGLYNLLTLYCFDSKLRDHLATALKKYYNPAIKINLLTGFLISRQGQCFLSRFAVDHEGFNTLLNDALDLRETEIRKHIVRANAYDGKTAQLYHLIRGQMPVMNDEHTQFFKNLVVSTQKRLPRESTHTLLYFDDPADNQKYNRSLDVTCLNWISKTEATLWPGLNRKVLFEELQEHRKLVASLIYNQRGINDKNLLRFMAVLLTAMAIFKKISSLIEIEHIQWGDYEFVVINRIQWLDVNIANGYQGAYILDRELMLVSFKELEENHPLKRLLNTGLLDTEVRIFNPLAPLVKLRACEVIDDRLEAVTAPFYKFICDYLLLPDLLCRYLYSEDTIPVKITSALKDNKPHSLTTALIDLFTDPSISETYLFCILLQTKHPQMDTSVFEYALSCGKIEPWLELLNHETTAQKLVSLLRQHYFFETNKTKPVCNILLTSENGLELFDAILEYVNKCPKDYKNSIYSWLHFIFTPRLSGDQSSILLRYLIFKVQLYKYQTGPLYHLLKNILAQIKDWRFVLPYQDKIDFMPIIYQILQPELRSKEFNLIPQEVLVNIFTLISLDYSYLITPFKDDMSNTTTTLEQMTKFRKNQELFSLIDPSAPEVLVLLTPSLLFGSALQPKTSTVEFANTIFYKLLQCSRSCTLIYNALSAHPENFELLIKFLKNLPADSPIWGLMEKTVYTRHFLRICDFREQDPFYINRTTLSNYLELIKKENLKSLCDRFSQNTPSLADFSIGIAKLLGDCKEFPETKDWDWQTLSEEIVELLESLRMIIDVIEGIKQGKVDNYALAMILSYALSRYVLPKSLDFELKLAVINQSDYVVFCNPTMSMSEASLKMGKMGRYIAYVVNTGQFLIDDDITRYISSKSGINFSMGGVWSNLRGINYLRSFCETQIRFNQNNSKLCETLDNLLQFVTKDLFFGNQFDNLIAETSAAGNRHGFLNRSLAPQLAASWIESSSHKTKCS